METLPEGRHELVVARSPHRDVMPVSLETVRAQKTHALAFSLACAHSGLDDGEIAGALKMSAGYFSKIRGGTATLQADLVAPFCRVVQNLVYPEWLAYQVGCTLTVLETETERRAKAAEAEVANLKSQLLALQKAVGGGFSEAASIPVQGIKVVR